MDTILLAITIVSLGFALIMSAAAWRLSRDERARRDARIAALAAAASDHDVMGAPQVPAAPPPVMPAPSPVAAEPPQVFKPRVPVSPPWAPARVAEPSRVAEAADDSFPGDSFRDSFLGGSQARPAASAQRGLAIAAAVLFVALLTGGYFTVFAGDSPARAAAAGTQAPLELVSLRHERQTEGLDIIGLVRNPVSGANVEKLAAVVLLFDQRGGLVTSSRADVDFTRLRPGDESPFVITLAAPSTVTRYRVSFRNDAGVVPHIDRRGQEPIARDTP